MKLITLLSFFALLTNFSFGQTKKADNYMVFYDKSSIVNYFKMGSSSYIDYYLDKKVRLNDNEYYARVRKYSWGSSDTSYFREDSRNYYHFDPKIGRESVVMPKEVTVGQEWFEADSSWSYEVIAVNEKLETPAKKYKGLIVIECLQVTGRDKDKSKAYHIYYAEGIGMVASVNNKNLKSYLSEIRK